MKLEQLNDENSAQIRSYLFRFSELLVEIGADSWFQKYPDSWVDERDAALLKHPTVISFFVQETGVSGHKFAEVKKLVERHVKKSGSDYLIMSLAMEIYFYSHNRISQKDSKEIEAFIRLVAEVAANYHEETLYLTDYNELAAITSWIADTRTFDINLFYREDEKPAPVFVMPGRKRFNDGDGFIFECTSLAETIEVRLLRANLEEVSEGIATRFYWKFIDNGILDEELAKRYIEESEISELAHDYVQRLRELTNWHRPKNVLVKLLILAKFSHLSRNHAAGLLRDERRKFGEFVEKTLKDIDTEISEVSHSLITTSYGVKFNTSELIAKGFGKRRSRVITELEDKNSPYSYYEFCNYRRITNCIDEWLKELVS